MRPSNYIARPSALAMNVVLRKTYFLLSLTLLFSAVTASFAVVKNVAYMNPILSLVGWFGLYFLTIALRNNPVGGLIAIFAFTGFTGFALGPVLNTFIHGYANGPQVVAMALTGTGVIFLALSGYVLITKKDFSFLGGFLFVGLLVGMLAAIAGIFINVPMFQLAISAAFILLASGMILFDTSRILNGGEQNYIMATIQLYIDIYMVFINLLQILGAFGGRRD